VALGLSSRASRWFATYKRRHRDAAWLSYL
jgi:hypothetical protein